MLNMSLFKHTLQVDTQFSPFYVENAAFKSCFSSFCSAFFSSPNMHCYEKSARGVYFLILFLVSAYFPRDAIFICRPNQFRRTKGKNWTMKEEENLLKLCEPHLSIIESKRSGKVAIKEKNTVWTIVVNNYKARCANDRVKQSILLFVALHVFNSSLISFAAPFRQ